MTTIIVDWDNKQRRMSSFGALGAALVVILGALAAWWFVDATPEWVYWALVGVLALVLVFMVLLLVLKPRASAQMAAEAAPEAAEGGTMPAPEGDAAPMPAFEPRVLTLRCGDCGTIFDVTDTGERPLYHTCPGCGAEGALRDPVEGAPASEAAPEAMPDTPPPMQDEVPDAPPMAEAPQDAPAPIVLKRIKLRCGGCKEIFSIDDTGERPLKRGCPSCGRMGMIR